MLKGGAKKGFGVVSTWKFEVLAILKGGAESFHHYKGGQKVSTCLEVGAQKVSDP